MKKKIEIVILLICCVAGASAQDGFTLKQDSLRSAVLNQTRKLNIFLPAGYDTARTRFPVIYVLDAEERDQHIVPTARFLLMNKKMPAAIIVGVTNIDRNHDFLPDSSKNAPTGGGADNFIRFFREELIPYIDKNFKTEPYNVLIGHSYGGLFAMYALAKEPDLFSAYIAIDPSIWYKNLMYLKIASREFPMAKNWDKTIFITGREGEGMKEMGITSLDTLMKESAPANLSWKIVAYPNEDHGSVPFKSAYDGLRYIFDTGASLQVYPMSGIIPAGIKFNVYLMNINPDMRYTTDGSEPTSDSPQCQTKLELTGACTLKIKCVTRKYNKLPTATFVFRQDNFLHGLKSVDRLKSGLKYDYYEGAYDSVPDLKKLCPVKSGITENINLNMAARKDSFALRFDGYLHIKEKTLYYLWINSDDGSLLYIGKNLILDNNGIHSADIPAVTALPLSPGYYPITVKYFEKSGNESIAAGMIKWDEDLSPVPFDNEVLFHQEE